MGSDGVASRCSARGGGSQRGEAVLVYGTVRPGNAVRWCIAVLVAAGWLAAGAGAALARPDAGSALAPALRTPVAAGPLALPAPTRRGAGGVRAGGVGASARPGPGPGEAGPVAVPGLD